jgi:photosystem II stability/assembly factor-like uncharacterized protein
MLTRTAKLGMMVVIALAAGLGARTAANAADVPSTTEAKPDDIMENIKFRNLGPAIAGGRVTVVVGVPGQPNLYYIGAAAGGVFKTIDGGISWKPIFEKEPVASIGAVALAPSNPNLIWVGTGEANIRNDVVTGHGVYFSPDAGASWKFMGLADVGQISSVIVHPTNPDIVYVGALGHAWAPNPDRGVYRTTDGGKTWQKVLFVDDKTGVGDMIMDPGNPMVLFAGMWQVQRFPWELVSGGPSSGLYRSTDGGSTWKKLTEGLPEAPLGRIGLAAAPSNPNHIYALVEAKKGRLWDSHDLGDHWTQVSDNHMLTVRGFYFSHLFVAPNSEEKIYFLSYLIAESTDGGKTAHPISRGVHPDHHALWIDPQDPNRLIEGNDGGVYISSDAGQHWRYLDNLPIEQFYAVAADDHTPYNLCGGLQDNNAWCGPSNSLGRGGITGFDWMTVAGGDGEYAVPAPGSSSLIYVDSQNGSIAQLDSQTGLARRIRPYLAGVEEFPPSDLKYRFNWTSPIATSRTDPNEVYLGANVLFKSTDSGTHWNAISPDLTRNDKSKQVVSGGPIEYDISGAETYDTILSMSISPVDPKVIWVGTDDGVVQVTRDGGEHWTNVSANIPKLPEWGRIQQIEAGPFSADTADVAVDFHETDDTHPYVFKTHDFGKTWAAISKGLPGGDPARVVREDPNHQGFLVVGTDTGLFYSTNDGDEWKPLKSDFPTAPIYDLKFIKSTHDLVIATHGRGLFVLDNITPLEEMTTQIAAEDFHLFPMLTARRWHMWNKHGFSSGGFTSPNPPEGASIDYYAKSEIKEKPAGQGDEGQGGQNPGIRPDRGPVKITIADADGKVVNTLHGPAKAGFNRMSWSLDYEGPTRLAFVRGEQEEENPLFNRNAGPPVDPGTYKITVTVKGQSQSQTVQVEADPRFHVDKSVFEAQTKAALEVRDEVSALNRALNRLENLHTQIAALEKVLQASGEGNEEMVPASYRPVLQEAKALDKKLRKIETDVYNTEVQPAGEDDIHYLARFHDRLTGIMRGAMASYDQPPSEIVLEEMATLRKELETHLQEFNNFLKTDVTAFNKMALEKGANTLFAGDTIELKGRATQAAGAAQGGGETSSDTE